jgi:hypothetical protein
MSNLIAPIDNAVTMVLENTVDDARKISSGLGMTILQTRREAVRRFHIAPPDHATINPSPYHLRLLGRLQKELDDVMNEAKELFVGFSTDTLLSGKPGPGVQRTEIDMPDEDFDRIIESIEKEQSGSNEKP